MLTPISATGRPASSRNHGRLQIGTVADIISEQVAGLNRNPHSRLVEKDEALGIHVALPHPPTATMLGHIGPVLLRGSQRLFLCDRPSRCSMSAMVESAFTSTPRSPSLAWISRRVMP